MRWVAALVASAGLTIAISLPAAAQGLPALPQWMRDSTFFFRDTDPRFIDPIASNRYLTLWQYHTGNDVSRFNLWTNAGDPLNPGDDYFLNLVLNNGNLEFRTPWGGHRLISGTFSPAAADRPFGNIATVRVEDAGQQSGFTDHVIPDDATAVFGPPVLQLPRFQGTFSTWRVTSGGGGGGGGTNTTYDLEVTQNLEFARDLLRVEYVVKNVGPTARRAGIRLWLNPAADEFPAGPVGLRPSTPLSFFIPQTRERIFREKDFGRAVGTTLVPRDGRIPESWEMFDDDEGPNPNLIVKGILKANGATTPDRVVFGNGADMAQADWDYAIQPDTDLSLTDMAVMLYWDPVLIPGNGGVQNFVTYVGMGVASHGMSGAYLRSHEQMLQPGASKETQGYIGAVQAPFALPLADVDGDGVDDPVTATVTAYVQNEYHRTQLPNAFAVIDLPDGLKFADSAPDQPVVLALGSPDAVGSFTDEASGSWVIQPDGADAGLLPISVTFNNGFQDSVRVVRLINVPQGRKYQLTDTYKFVTFPFTFDAFQDDPAEVLGLEPGTFVLLRWNPAANFGQGEYEQVTRIQPGEGYWVRLLGLGTTTINIQNANPVKLFTGQTLSTRVSSRWNMVGNPSPYAVPVRDIKLRLTGGFLISFAEAVRRGLVGPALFEYDPKTGRYVQLSQDSVIQPGHGFWLFARGEQVLVWPPPEGPQISIIP